MGAFIVKLLRLFFVFVGACIVKLLDYLQQIFFVFVGACIGEIVRLFVDFVGACIVIFLDYLLFLWEPVLSYC